MFILEGVAMAESLLTVVEQVREKMIFSAVSKGLLNEETIQLSIQLDSLLNEYQRLTNCETHD